MPTFPKSWTRRHPIHHVNSHVAARYGTTQVEVLSAARALGDKSDAAIQTWFNRLFGPRGTLRAENPFEAYRKGLLTFRELPQVIAGVLGPAFAKVAITTSQQTASHLASSVPLPYLRIAALRPVRPLLEEELPIVRFGPAGIEELLTRFADPNWMAGASDGQKRDFLQELLFPPPTEDQVRAIVYGNAGARGQTSWIERLQQETSLASPEQIAPLIVQSFTAGQNHQELAKLLLPIVGGVQATARRIARDESMRIAHHMQSQAHEALADITLGYQVHATLDQNTRPAHAARNGTIYYMHPKDDEPGLDEMPHPPEEADGSIAHNCRCWTAPVLTPPSHIVNDPAAMQVFRQEAKLTVPDVVHYPEWFGKAPEPLRRQVVGTGRYSTMQKLLRGRHPSWAHFVDPATGELLTRGQLQQESDADRKARVAEVRRQARQRAQDLRTTLTYGFLPHYQPGLPFVA